jgi:hypothetical protein
MRFTFRRTVGRRVMNLWLELVQIAETIRFNDELDALIWKYNSGGKYSVQSLYEIINDGGGGGKTDLHTCSVEDLGSPKDPYIFMVVVE